MRQEIFISIDARERRAVLLEDGWLMEILIERDDSQVGKIYKGRVENVIAGMNAAFVDIGMLRNGFLCADDASAHLSDLDHPDAQAKRRITDIAKKGQDTMVQVVKEVIGTKGARLTTNISLSGRFFVLLPTVPAGHIGVSHKITDTEERDRLYGLAEQLVAGFCGAIVRTAAEGRTLEELQGDWQALRSQWEVTKNSFKLASSPALLYSGVSLVDKVVRDWITPNCERLIIDNPTEYSYLLERLRVVAPYMVNKVQLYRNTVPLFIAHNIDSRIEKALHSKVRLHSGGNLVVERTEALWVIDVNTAQNVDKNAILATNLEACREVCRQMRLRDMGGIIIVDFINMDSESQQEQLLECLSEELKRDRVRTRLVGITELGLVQLTRKREGKDLERIMREPCPHCHGMGRVMSARATALKLRRELLHRQGECRHSGYMVRCTPRTAWYLVGDKGELAGELCSELKCDIAVHADGNVSAGEFEIEPIDGCSCIPQPLDLGQQGQARLFPHYSGSPDSCLATLEGHLLEITNGADFCGEELAIKVTEVGRYISRGRIVSKIIR